MKAVIMAGGEGSRLRPLTCTRPKPMVPVLNRPCMEHIVDILRSFRIREIGVTLQYLPEEIQTYFGTGEDFNVSLKYFVEDTPLGTAGSVKNAASFLDETFIVISGDALTDCNLKEAYEFHRAKGALATLILTPVTCPLEYGVVITGKEGQIKRFLEKPGWGEVFSDTVNTGIYILEPEILDFIDENKTVDFSKDLYPRLLAAGKPLYAFVTDGYWCDIGSVEAYIQAHYDLLNQKAGFAFPGREIMPGVWAGEKAEIDSAAQVMPPAVIGEDTYLGPDTKVGPFTVLGQGVRVERGASLKKSVVWDHARIGEGAQIRGAVIGVRARVKEGVAAFEGAVIGDRSVVGEKSIVKPGVKIWPEKWIDKGTRLSSSLVWGNCARPRFFGAQGIAGDLVTEICPEFAARIGVAIGSVSGLPARFSLCTDEHPCSQMGKHAVCAGLLATGVKVVDFGDVTLPVHRYGIRALQLSGGVHIYHMEKDKVNLRFFNAQGMDYSRSEQRKVEGMINREEYRYTSADQIAAAEYIPDIGRSYLNYLLGFLDQDVIQRARLKLVVDYDPERLGSLLPPLFENLGCDLITFAASRKHPQALTEMIKTAGHFGELVTEQGAHFGAVLDATGEEVVLVDDRGRIVQDDLLLSLLSLIILGGNEQPTLALPVTAPTGLEELVMRSGGNVRRTKTAPWSLMQAFLDEDVLRSQKRCPQFLFYGDALATLGAITGFLAREGRLLSEILEEIPSFAIARRKVEVTWEDKGKVLRSLAEGAEERQVEMIEGIKMYHPEGWALVLPDADEPLCKIYSEGFNQEIAESLTEMYVEKIKGICERDGSDRARS